MGRKAYSTQELEGFESSIQHDGFNEVVNFYTTMHNNGYKRVGSQSKLISVNMTMFINSSFKKTLV